jgi:glycine hydroxymethyltransferase
MAKEAFAKQIDGSIMPGLQGGPLLHIIAAKAISFQEALQPSFKEYQEQIVTNARLMVQLFKDKGYRIISEGTDNHLFVIDLRSKHCTGLDAERALEKVGISVSRSGIPSDPQPARITSGIRIGTPAITTRGIKKEGIPFLVDTIDEAISERNNERILQQLAGKIKEYALAHVNEYVQALYINR